jgi:hypothetical protein
VFNNQGDRCVNSVRLLVRFDSQKEASGFFKAMADGGALNVAARNLQFYDEEFMVDGRDAPQYRPVSEFGHKP